MQLRSCMYIFSLLKMQVGCHLRQLPPQLCGLKQLVLLNLSGSPALLSLGGAALAAANLSGLAACRYMDLSTSRSSALHSRYTPMRYVLRCLSSDAASLVMVPAVNGFAVRSRGLIFLSAVPPARPRCTVWRQCQLWSRSPSCRCLMIVSWMAVQTMRPQSWRSQRYVHASTSCFETYSFSRQLRHVCNPCWNATGSADIPLRSFAPAQELAELHGARIPIEPHIHIVAKIVQSQHWSARLRQHAIPAGQRPPRHADESRVVIRALVLAINTYKEAWGL